MDARTLLRLFYILILLTFLSGCAASVASSGAQAVYDRHNIKQSMNDHYITMQAYRKLYIDTDRFKNTNISVATLNSRVLMTGQIPTTEQRYEAETIVKKIPGIHELYNQTTLSSPSSPLIRISDSWITAKIKSKLIAIDDIDPSLIKVVTENGTVYLMGIVPPQQASIAVEIARTTEGVQNVVKVFYYIRISRA